MFKKLWKYLLPVILAYYIYPLYVLYSPDASQEFLIGSLLFINPIVVFISSLFYAFNHKFEYEISIIIAVLFVPATMIFFNSSALVYVFVYFILSLLAQYTGKHAQRKIK